MTEPFSYEDVIEEFQRNLTSDRLVDLLEVDVEGHCLGCEQPIDDYHLKECEFVGCARCGRENCICEE